MQPITSQPSLRVNFQGHKHAHIYKRLHQTLPQLAINPRESFMVNFSAKIEGEPLSAEKLNVMRYQGKMTDLEIRTSSKGQVIRAHRCLVAAASPLLERKLTDAKELDWSDYSAQWVFKGSSNNAKTTCIRSTSRGDSWGLSGMMEFQLSTIRTGSRFHGPAERKIRSCFVTGEMQARWMDLEVVTSKITCR